MPALAVLPSFLDTQQADDARAVRVQGRVHAGSKGIAGVAVTDGLNVTRTDEEGRYELISNSRRDFVYLSLPSGYQIPTNPTGTARFYQPLRSDGNGEAEAVFELAPRQQSDDRHTFFLLADPQTQNLLEITRFHNQTVPDVRALANAYDRPTFGIGCGDLMFDHLELFPKYEEAVSMMETPFFQVVGNHDLVYEKRTSEAAAQTFERHFGPDHYSFNVGEVHYVILNDVFWHGTGYIGYLTGEQLAWLEADLASVEPGRTVVMAMHIPALSMQFARDGESGPSTGTSVQNREALYELLDPYEAHLLTGHTHENEHVFEGGVHEHIHGTVCGAWWSGPICFDGTPKGYGVYDVHGSDLRWRYKSTGHDLDHQLRTYEAGADPEAPDQFLANVWGWDPEWEVVWYEDGARRGRMEQRTARDPLSVELHEGEEEPRRRPWVEPHLTDHLFYAPAAPHARSILVEATDRWGRTYTSTLR